MSVGQTDIVGDSLSVRAKYFRVNSLIICGLFVLSMVSIPLLGFPENSIIYFFAQRFNHDVELSVPTLYNYFLILSNFGLITLVYLSERSMRTSQAPYWLFLAVVMFLMSYDEAARVHERREPADRRAPREKLARRPLASGPDLDDRGRRRVCFRGCGRRNDRGMGRLLL